MKEYAAVMGCKVWGYMAWIIRYVVWGIAISIGIGMGYAYMVYGICV